MAFKSFNQYQEDKNGEFFVLPNDKDYADVIFLYRSAADVLIAEGVHYLSTASYKGYAHCCGDGCPACKYPTQSGRGIRRDTKLFIPLYNINKNKIEFWDRTPFFEQRLQTDVFSKFPNPSECVFRITRDGAAGSRDTKYSIVPIGRNSSRPYEKLLADAGVSLPDYYNTICKEMTIAEMANALNASSDTSNLQEYGYTPVPRGAAAEPPVPELNVATPTYSEPPVTAPPVADMPEYNADLMPEYNSADVAPAPIADFPSEETAPSGDDDLDNPVF